MSISRFTSSLSIAKPLLKPFSGALSGRIGCLSVSDIMVSLMSRFGSNFVIETFLGPLFECSDGAEFISEQIRITTSRLELNNDSGNSFDSGVSLRLEELKLIRFIRDLGNIDSDNVPFRFLLGLLSDAAFPTNLSQFI